MALTQDVKACVNLFVGHPNLKVLQFLENVGPHTLLISKLHLHI